MVPRTVYAGTSFDTLTQGRQNFELCNDSTTGTSLNFLAKYNGATPACAVKAGMSDTDGVIGVVSNGSGTSGNAVITYRGYAQCSFDQGTTVGDYVVASTTNAGDCHDAGGTRPTGVQVLGRVESTNTGAGTYGVRISLDAPGGTGAPVSSPTFTGTVTLPDGTTDSASGLSLGTAVTLPGGSTAATQSTGDNSTKVATTAYVQSQGYLTNQGIFLDASRQPGTTLDVKINNANAVAITSGNATIDARALGGAQTITSEVSIGQLRPPVLSAPAGTSPGAGTYKLVYTLTSPTASETSASMESTIVVDGSHSIQMASPTYYGTATSYSVYMTPVNDAGIGTVNTTGTTVNWVSGSQFNASGSWSGQAITINQVHYTIVSVASATQLTVNTSIGTQTGVPYSAGNWDELKCSAATNVPIGTNATVTAACSGTAVSLSNAGFGVHLAPPKTGVWSVAIDDPAASFTTNQQVQTGPNTSCGLRFHDQSSYAGLSMGEGRPFFLSSASSSTDVRALICTDDNSKYPDGYYNLTGLAAHNTAGDNVRTAVIVFAHAADESVFEGEAAVWTAIPAIWTWQVGAASKIMGHGEANMHGIPLRISRQGSQASGLDINNMSLVHPGPAFPNIEIQGYGVRNVHFTGTTYFEGVSWTGTVTTTSSSAAVVKTGGSNFNADGSWNGAPISIAGTWYTVSSVTDTTHLTLTTNVTTGGTGQAYSMGCSSPIQVATIANVTGPVDFDSLYHGAYCNGTTSPLLSVPGSSTVQHLSARAINNGNFTNIFHYSPNSTLDISGVGNSIAYPGFALNLNNPQTMLSDLQVSGAVTVSGAATLGAATATTPSAGDNSTKVATTAYVRNETQLAWTCPVAGSTAISQNCNWTLPAGLTITGFDFAANTAPAGCTTYPTVQLWDGTTGVEVGSYSVTLTSGTSFYPKVAGSTNLSAGDQLRVKVTTAAAGCAPYPAGMVATVTYQMQN